MKEKRNPTNLEREIASRLKELRLKKNMTAKKVAELVGVSAMTMSRYENAEIVNIPIDNIYKLSEIYNTTITYILSGIKELNIDNDPLLMLNSNIPFQFMYFSPGIKIEKIEQIKKEASKYTKYNLYNNEHDIIKTRLEHLTVQSSTSEIWYLINYFQIDVNLTEILFMLPKFSEVNEILENQKNIVDVLTQLNDTDLTKNLLDYIEYRLKNKKEGL